MIENLLEFPQLNQAITNVSSDINKVGLEDGPSNVIWMAYDTLSDGAIEFGSPQTLSYDTGKMLAHISFYKL